MSEIDYNRIENIVRDISKEVSTDLIAKTVKNVLTSYGIHDAKQTQENMVFLEDLKQNRDEIKKSFFRGVGSHVLTFVLAVGAIWVASVKGIFGS